MPWIRNPLLYCGNRTPRSGISSFFFLDHGQELEYRASPQEFGGFELSPTAPLGEGTYCFVQGDPIGVSIPAWCFNVGEKTAADQDDYSSIELSARPTEVDDQQIEAVLNLQIEYLEIALNPPQAPDLNEYPPPTEPVIPPVPAAPADQRDTAAMAVYFSALQDYQTDELLREWLGIAQSSGGE